MPNLRIFQRGRLRQIDVQASECLYTSKESYKNWLVWLQRLTIFMTFRKVPDVDLVWTLVSLRPRKSQGFSLGAKGKRSQCPSSRHPARGNSVFHRQHLMWTIHIILDWEAAGWLRKRACLFLCPDFWWIRWKPPILGRGTWFCSIFQSKFTQIHCHQTLE
jgi:hypothetical protein